MRYRHEGDYEHLTKEMLKEEEQFQYVCSMLLSSGEFLESEIEEEAHHIMDNRHDYPGYFL